MDDDMFNTMAGINQGYYVSHIVTGTEDMGEAFECPFCKETNGMRWVVIGKEWAMECPNCFAIGPRSPKMKHAQDYYEKGFK